MAIMRPEGRLSRQGGANTGGQRGRWEQEAAGLEFLPREEFSGEVRVGEGVWAILAG